MSILRTCIKWSCPILNTRKEFEFVFIYFCSIYKRFTVVEVSIPARCCMSKQAISKWPFLALWKREVAPSWKQTILIRKNLTLYLCTKMKTHIGLSIYVCYFLYQKTDTLKMSILGTNMKRSSSILIKKY